MVEKNLGTEQDASNLQAQGSTEDSKEKDKQIRILYAAALLHSAARESSNSQFPGTRLAIARSQELQNLIVEHAPILLGALAALSKKRIQ